jgi:hypothetical protein
MLAIGLVTAVTVSNSALAAKQCNLVGSWVDSYSETFTMTSQKHGSAGSNPECSDEKADITTTKITEKVWNLKVHSKKCSVIITGDYDFDAGSCTSATGTLTIPGVGQLADSITKQ